jgi:hypothetical protein
MHRTLAASLLGLMLALPALAQEPAATTESEGTKVKATMVKFQDDLQALEADAVAKSVTLNAEEAAAFWPQFKAYQAEQREIADGQIDAVKNFADNFQTLSDADAQAYVSALLERDRQVHELRVKYLGLYAKTIGPRKAATVVHLARKLGFASQARLAEVIPLVR